MAAETLVTHARAPSVMEFVEYAKVTSMKQACMATKNAVYIRTQMQKLVDQQQFTEKHAEHIYNVQRDHALRLIAVAKTAHEREKYMKTVLANKAFHLAPPPPQTCLSPTRAPAPLPPLPKQPPPPPPSPITDPLNDPINDVEQLLDNILADASCCEDATFVEELHQWANAIDD